MKRIILIMSLMMSLAGCGLFGGGSKPAPYTPTNMNHALGEGDSGQIATTSPTVPVATDTTFSAQFIALLNPYRQSKGLQPVAEDALLDNYALLHSQDMAKRGVMDHANFTTDFHYIGRIRCDQNVAWNYLTPQTLMSAWQGSPPHNANMLDAKVTTAGAAIVNGYATLWVCSKP